MGRHKFNPRYEKNLFHHSLSIVRSRYIDAFHRDAGGRVLLQALTNKLRVPPLVPQVVSQSVPKEAVIYGAHHTMICTPVTKETLNSRRGIAATIEPHLKAPRDKMNFWKAMRAKKFANLHEPFLKSSGPFESDIPADGL